MTWTVLSFILRHRKILGALCAVLAIGGLLLSYGHAQYKKGYRDANNECNAEKQETIGKSIETNEKQRRVPVLDDAGYIDSLRGGSF